MSATTVLRRPARPSVRGKGGEPHVAAGSSGSPCSRSWSSGHPDARRADHVLPSGGVRESSGWWTALAHPFRTTEWTLENYRLALDGGGLGNAFMNSLAVAVPATVIPIAIAAFAAYAFSWMEFRGRYVMFVTRRGPPGRATPDGSDPDPPPVQQGRGDRRSPHLPDLDLVGTFLGVWLAHTGFGLPLAVYLLRNYIGSLPSSIIESAKMDGADHFTIFWRLIIPLSVPALAAFAIFQFLWVWNDLLVAYVFLGGTQQNRVLTIALANLVGAEGRTGTCSPRPRSSRCRCRWSSSSPCRSTSSAVSRRAP